MIGLPPQLVEPGTCNLRTSPPLSGDGPIFASAQGQPHQPGRWVRGVCCHATGSARHVPAASCPSLLIPKSTSTACRQFWSCRLLAEMPRYLSIRLWQPDCSAFLAPHSRRLVDASVLSCLYNGRVRGKGSGLAYRTNKRTNLTSQQAQDFPPKTLPSITEPSCNILCVITRPVSV